VGAACGLAGVRVGDVCGGALPRRAAMTQALLTVRITPDREQDYPALAAAVGELEAEDPFLAMSWEKEERELLVNVTGFVQIEVLQSILQSRFGLRAVFGRPTVIYKETPLAPAVGFEAYTMPKPCWAILKFAIEPLPVGAGVEFVDKSSPERLLPRYLAQVRQTIPQALRQGPKGWEATDLRLTLVDGESHVYHTHPLDFALATPLAVMNGLVAAGTGLLEPMLRFVITVPEELSGRLIGEVVNLRGSFDTPVIRKGLFTMEGRYPAATTMDFPSRLAALTSGRAALSHRFDGYQPCPDELGTERRYRGISPRDRAKYILWARGAIQGTSKN